jgi:hypothetical protein
MYGHVDVKNHVDLDFEVGCLSQTRRTYTSPNPQPKQATQLTLPMPHTPRENMDKCSNMGKTSTS